MFCLDKPKFGGPNKKKNACQARKCLNMYIKPEEDQSEESTMEDRGGSEDSCSSGENNTGATCDDLSRSDKRDFIPEDGEDEEKIDIKPATRGSVAALKETSPKPAVKRRRISLDDSKLRQKAARTKKQSLVTKQKRYSVTNY